MARDIAQEKRDREAKRRKRFTEEQKQAVRENARLYVAHRRATDAEFLAKSRQGVKDAYGRNKAKRQLYARNRTWETRVAALKGYSSADPFCMCCGETTLEFLTLDHIVDRRNDDGVRVGGDREGSNLYAWLIRMGFPPGFRVLCFNCNCARGVRGYCPHELTLEEEIERTNCAAD